MKFAVSARHAAAPFSLGRAAGFAVGGGVLVYAATWIGPVAFWLDFQRDVYAQGQGDEHRPLTWHVPREVEPAPAPGWTFREDAGGGGFPLPPGRLLDVDEEGEFRTVRYEEASFGVGRLPPGYLAEDYRRRVLDLGGTWERDRDDVAALHEILGAVPGLYRFDWPEERRQLYAARILGKRLLFGDSPVARCELSTRAEPRVSAALVEYENGEAKIVRIDGQGILVVVLGRDAPPAWKASAAPWLTDDRL